MDRGAPRGTELKREFGFVVEGDSESTILPSLIERAFIGGPPPGRVGRSINAHGSKIMSPDYLAERVKRLRQGNHQEVIVVLDGEHSRSSDQVKADVAARGQRVDHVIVFEPCFEALLASSSEALAEWLDVPPTTLPPVVEDKEQGCWPKRYLNRLSQQYRKQRYKEMRDGRLIAAMLQPQLVATQVPAFRCLLEILRCPAVGHPLEAVFEDE